MFDYLLVSLVAFGASLLTLYSGFGLGTLLLPVFVLMAPLPVAIAATAVVHLANNLFKARLLAHAVDWRVLRYFLPTAIPAAFAGAWLLGQLSDAAPWFAYTLGNKQFQVEPVKCVIGMVILSFVFIEGLPQIKRLALAPRWMPVGGLLSGFFGGLSGHQGALRSMFLIKCGLDASAFVATGVVIALAIDISRLALYGRDFWNALGADMRGIGGLMAAASIAAFAGAWLGVRWLKKVKMPLLQRIVAAALIVVGLSLLAGWI